MAEARAAALARGETEAEANAAAARVGASSAVRMGADGIPVVNVDKAVDNLEATIQSTVKSDGAEFGDFLKSAGNYLTGKGWTSKDTDGAGGQQFFDPKNPKGNNVRIMPGNPNSPNPSQQGPYVKVQSGGKFVDQNGNPIDPKANNNKPGALPEAHIPADKGMCILGMCFGGK